MTGEEKAEEYAIKITDELINKGFLTNEEINQRYAGIVQGVLYGLEEEREKLENQIVDMQIMEYSNLYEQRKKIHKELIDGFTEQLGILDKEDDVLFSLEEIKSIINSIMELEL